MSIPHKQKGQEGFVLTNCSPLGDMSLSSGMGYPPLGQEGSPKNMGNFNFELALIDLVSSGQ